MKRWNACSLVIPFFMGAAFAQTPIERIKITDNDLSCPQILEERNSMDRVITEAKAAQSSGQTTATAGQAAGVAAEVAQRTGVFGAIGGLAGQLFGGAATKAAANVAEQSGQKDVAEAAQREKQALARKEQLAQLYLSKGCSQANAGGNAVPAVAAGVAPAPAPAAPVSSAGAANPSSPAAPPASSGAAGVSGIGGVPESDPSMRLPELNAGEWFDGKAGGTFGEKTVNFLPRSKRVAVVGFKVIFVNETSARARVRASYLPGRDTSGASAAMQVNLRGVDDAALQALTDQAYARFVAQLRASGREVLTAADGQWDYKEFQAAPSPFDVAFMQTKGRAFAPKGMPLWSLVGDPWAGTAFDQTNNKALGVVSNKAGAVLAIAPSIVVDFAQMASSGNRSGLVARTAEVGTTLAISVNRLDALLVRAEEIKFGNVAKGDVGWLNLTRPLETDLEFAVLKTAEKDHGSGVAGFLSKAFVGTGKTEFRAAETTNGEYSKAATAVLERATGTLAKLFADNPAK